MLLTALMSKKKGQRKMEGQRKTEGSFRKMKGQRELRMQKEKMMQALYKEVHELKRGFEEERGKSKVK